MASNFEKLFVKEVSVFLVYSKWIWPLHRRLFASYITPRCSNCIISSKLSPLNSQGLCKDCAGLPIKSKIMNTEAKGESFGNLVAEDFNSPLSLELKDTLRKAEGAGEKYDALVLFSGGKDSCYLVHHLQSHYPRMRILLLTIDNSFMSPVALRNIDSVLSRLSLPFIQFRPPSSLMEKMFRQAFLNLNEKGCSGTVDQFDGDFFHDLGRNLARDLRIPFLISGCSRTQVERILKLNHFESPREQEKSRRQVVAGIKLEEFLDSKEMEYWWDGSKSSFVPRVLFPFYAWNLSEEEIKATVVELGLVSENSNNPLLTNSTLVPLMGMVDMVRFGYSSFEAEFSQMVREGKADPHFWRPVFEMTEYAAKTGSFVSQSVDLVLKRLKLKRSDLGLPQ